MENDPVVERIRRIKREIARKFDYDLHKFTEYIRDKQKNSGAKLVNTLKIVKNKSSSTKF